MEYNNEVATRSGIDNSITLTGTIELHCIFKYKRYTTTDKWMGNARKKGKNIIVYKNNNNNNKY